MVARAPGIGAFGSDATAQVTLAFIVIDAPPGELPPSLLWRHEAHSEDLGVGIASCPTNPQADRFADSPTRWTWHRIPS